MITTYKECDNAKKKEEDMKDSVNIYITMFCVINANFKDRNKRK